MRNEHQAPARRSRNPPLAAITARSLDPFG
jgi:hypothetical protein